MSIEQQILAMCQLAKKASYALASALTQQKNQALHGMAEALLEARDALFAANQKDVEEAQRAHLPAPLIDRLTLNQSSFEKIVSGIREIILLTDPIGQVEHLVRRPSGIQVGKMRTPLGVVAIIYEARPNVTADAAALCIKSGNATILRGGSQAFHSNQIIARCLQEGLLRAQLPKHGAQMLEIRDHMAVTHLVKMTGLVDVAVLRGGKGLIEGVCQETHIPVIKHLDGICHVYIDEYADLDKALAIAINAKTQRYSTCNTMETLLVQEAIAPRILPQLALAYQEKGVEMRGCSKTCALLAGYVRAATDEDWRTEYLAPILSIRIVPDLSAAIAHIHTFGSQHTDSIVTENHSHAQRFLQEVASASVMVNASTRLSDGFEYGLGAEIGISTDKIHARGPVGLEGLTSQKWIVLGDGHLRH